MGLVTTHINDWTCDGDGCSVTDKTVVQKWDSMRTKTPKGWLAYYVITSGLSCFCNVCQDFGRADKFHVYRKELTRLKLDRRYDEFRNYQVQIYSGNLSLIYREYDSYDGPSYGIATRLTEEQAELLVELGVRDLSN